MSARSNVKPNELEECGFTAEQVEKAICALKSNLPEPVIEEIEKQDRLSVQTINRIVECSKVVDVISRAPGFSAVTRGIKSLELVESQAYWFQLRVGYIIFCATGKMPAFEQTIGDSDPKDIILDEGNSKILIECKYLGMGECRKDLIARHLNSPETQTVGKLLGPPEFKKTYQVLGFMPHKMNRYSSKIELNDYPRFRDKVIEGNAQTVKGFANIIAIESSQFKDVPDDLGPPLRELLVTDSLDRVSGLLLISRRTLPNQETRSLGGSVFAISLMVNSQAQVPLPRSFVASLPRQIAI